MKIVKKINNNVAIGIDGANREVVLFDRGLGFPSMPYELKDLSKIERSYYDVDPRFYPLAQDVDETIWKLTSKILDVIREKIPGRWNPNLQFILADHLNFAVQRHRQGLSIHFPYSEELELTHPEYVKYAAWIIRNVNHYMKVKLDSGEITCVAMHLINANAGRDYREETILEKTRRIQKDLTRIIEDHFQIHINHKDINYKRFRYHIQYFIQRKEKAAEFHDGNELLLEGMKASFPQSWSCAQKLNAYLQKEYGTPCSNDELLYLMIHINRLYQRDIAAEQQTKL